MTRTRRVNWAIVVDSRGTPLEVEFQGWRCRVLMEQYVDGRGPSLRLVDAGDGSSISRATSNVAEFVPQKNELLIKDDAENSGILALLVAANVVADTGKLVRSGFADLNVVRLTPHLAEQWNAFRNNLNTKQAPQRH